MPCNDRVLTSCLPGAANESVELGRFVLLDAVRANGESWFIARCFERLRADGFVGVVSFSDPVARTRLDGTTCFPGHIGGIYQATNGVYLGRGSPGTLRLLPDGTVLNHRSLNKLRAGDRGAAAVVEILRRHGAAPLDGDPHAWLATWLPRLTRTLRHHGCHKYAWGFAKSAKKQLQKAPSIAYPKFSLVV